MIVRRPTPVAVELRTIADVRIGDVVLVRRRAMTAHPAVHMPTFDPRPLQRTAMRSYAGLGLYVVRVGSVPQSYVKFVGKVKSIG